MTENVSFSSIVALTIPSLTPMLIASSALLALASLRNSDIATRSRNIVNERIENLVRQKQTDTDAKYFFSSRLNILKDQNSKLIQRYQELGNASLFLTYSIALFFISTIFGSFLRDELFVEGQYKKLFNLLVLFFVSSYGVGIFYFFSGTRIVVNEFKIGATTLEINSRSLEEPK